MQVNIRENKQIKKFDTLLQQVTLISDLKCHSINSKIIFEKSFDEI